MKKIKIKKVGAFYIAEKVSIWKRIIKYFIRF